MFPARVIPHLSIIQRVFRQCPTTTNDLKIANFCCYHKHLDCSVKFLEPEICPIVRENGRSLHHNIAVTHLRKMSSKPEKKTNRLALERSPYLLQHATNPVDWYPWGQEAFDKAKQENKIIFLSVGYSTCHWCHVMEKESFEDPVIAEIMNKFFVNIKVDREERPDVDRMYMGFIQATRGGGGWPMSVFLTPDLKPLTGGTYFPPEDKFARPGFKTILLNVAEQWKTKNKALTDSTQDGMASEVGSGVSEYGTNLHKNRGRKKNVRRNNTNPRAERQPDWGQPTPQMDY